MTDSIRAFIAIELNDDTHAELACLQSALKKSNADVKWAAPESIHLTLKFLGHIDTKLIKEIETILGGAMKGVEPFILTLKGIGAFPNLNSPRVIWAGVERGASESTHLAEALEEKLEAIGIPKEDRKFHPHITLGRVKSLKNCDKLKVTIEGSKFEFNSPVEVNHLTLFRSELTRKGPIYTPIFTANMANT